MVGCPIDIKKKTGENQHFCQVLFTGSFSQLAVVSLGPGEDIGIETHLETDLIIRVEAGAGKAILDGQEYELGGGSVIIIPACMEHNVINTSATEALKLCIVYSPPEYPESTFYQTKVDAEAYENKKYG